jgi:alpha-glucosidase (family GH31 glycosyl hydrolase)
MIGGFLQKFFVRGSKPDVVVQRYQTLIGKPQTPPFWAFGW